MARIDLDAKLAELRAARSEAAAEDHTLVFRGREFTFPPQAPFTFLEATMYARNETERAFLAVRALLGAEWNMFMEARPTVEEATAFLNEILAVWGLEDALGESPASGGSSSTTSGRSKRTSNGSTGSRSRTRSSATDPSASAD